MNCESAGATEEEDATSTGERGESDRAGDWNEVDGVKQEASSPRHIGQGKAIERNDRL